MSVFCRIFMPAHFDFTLKQKWFYCKNIQGDLQLETTGLAGTSLGWLQSAHHFRVSPGLSVSFCDCNMKVVELQQHLIQLFRQFYCSIQQFELDSTRLWPEIKRYREERTTGPLHGPLTCATPTAMCTYTHRMKILSIYKNLLVIIIADLKANLYPDFNLLSNCSIFSINRNLEHDSRCIKEQEKLLWPDVVIWNTILTYPTWSWGQLSEYSM